MVHISLGLARPVYQSATQERVWGQMWGSAVSDAGFVHERHLLMLPFKWTAKSMNIIIAVLVSELCKPVGTELGNTNLSSLGIEFKKIRTSMEQIEHYFKAAMRSFKCLPMK